jgi:antitoxin component YwqK of YwqJK toxin-antitoxin module
VREKGKYVNDKREGKFYIYDENGTLEKRIRYKNGEKK